jgi:AraC-like DNA-binding protein
VPEKQPKRVSRLGGVNFMAVSRSDIPPSPFLWTRGIAARQTLRYLEKKGFDAAPLLSKAELSRPQLTDDPGGISVASQHRFLELAAREIHDPLLGLHVAAELDTRDIGILFYLQASSATVAEALDYLARYGATTSEEIRLEISRQDGEILLTFHHVLESDDPRRQHSELVALAFNRVLRFLTNHDFAPRRMTFAHTRNRGLREVDRIMRCPVEFGQATDSWVLLQSDLELPILSKDSRLLQILEQHANDLLSARRSPAGLLGLVENQLLVALRGGRVQAAEVAEQLGMSERSFRRRLAEEGTSFGEVLDRLRNRLALRYLEDKSITLKQIAWRLGYSEPGAFNHAFKRWTGTSPNRTRYTRSAPGKQD